MKTTEMPGEIKVVSSYPYGYSVLVDGKKVATQLSFSDAVSVLKDIEDKALEDKDNESV